MVTEAQMEANPCRNCGVSDWWCLYEMNSGGDRCCWQCGLCDPHGVLAPAVSPQPDTRETPDA